MCIWDPGKNDANFRTALVSSSLDRRYWNISYTTQKESPHPWCEIAHDFLLPFCRLCILQLPRSSLWTFPSTRQRHRDSSRSIPQLLGLLLPLLQCCELRPSRGRLCICSSRRQSLAGARWTLPCCTGRESGVINKPCPPSHAGRKYSRSLPYSTKVLLESQLFTYKPKKTCNPFPLAGEYKRVKPF